MQALHGFVQVVGSGEDVDLFPNCSDSLAEVLLEDLNVFFGGCIFCFFLFV